VRELVQATPDPTLDEFVIELAKHGIATSRSGLDRYFAVIGWSFKKTLHAAEQNRPDVKAAREAWH
jgi:transposase